jgi:carboxymethylenebutenolidase
MGAAWALWCAAKRPAVAATVVYYGTMTGPSLARATVPVLGHFAEEDPYEPEEALRGFERALRETGRSLTIHRYPGTGHWFAEPSRDAWRPEAAQLAFDRTVEFLRSIRT